MLKMKIRKNKVININRNHKERCQNSDLSDDVLLELYRTTSKCPICDNIITEHNCNLHHIIPVVNGGKHVISNVQLICKVCHTKIHKKGTYSKGDKKTYTIKLNMDDKIIIEEMGKHIHQNKLGTIIKQLMYIGINTIYSQEYIKDIVNRNKKKNERIEKEKTLKRVKLE